MAQTKHMPLWLWDSPEFQLCASCETNNECNFPTSAVMTNFLYYPQINEALCETLQASYSTKITQFSCMYMQNVDVQQQTLALYITTMFLTRLLQHICIYRGWCCNLPAKHTAISRASFTLFKFPSLLWRTYIAYRDTLYHHHHN